MNKSISYFITGGLGFVGISLTNFLLSQDDTGSIFIYDFNKYPGRQALLKADPRVRIITGDVRDREFLRYSLFNAFPDVIVNLAAMHFIPECESHPNIAQEINIIGTKNLLECASFLPLPAVFVHASSAAVYKRKLGPIPEENPLEAVDVYGRTKLSCERVLLKNNTRNSHLRILRLFNIYGDMDPVPHIIPVILNQLNSGDIIKLGDTSASRDFIHVDDVSSAIYASTRIETNKYEIFNVGSGLSVSIDKVLEFILAAYRQKNPSKQIQIQKLDPDKIRLNDRPELCADISKITQKTGWAPKTNLESWLMSVL